MKKTLLAAAMQNPGERAEAELKGALQECNAGKHGDLKLNLGCGENLMEGYLNLDNCYLPGVNMLWDLEKTPLPFDDDSVIEVNCSHILEHVSHFIELMEELHRICRPGAIIRVAAPYYKYEGSYRDPTHVRFFTEHSFDYFRDGVKFSHYSQARFLVKKVRLSNHFFSSVRNWHKKLIIFVPFKKFLNGFLWNMYSEINFELEVVKEGGRLDECQWDE